MEKIGIVVIGYNRIDSISRLLTSLKVADYSNEQVDLIISIDKSQTDIVENFADGFEWQIGKKKVIKHSKNLGLREHILSQGKLFEFYDAIVVLEDDIVVSPLFYHFVKQSVEKYAEDDRIAGIGLYSYNVNYQSSMPFQPIKSEYDVFFMQCATSWGQIWMKRQWKDFIEWYRNNMDFKYSDKLPGILYTWPKTSWLKYHMRYCIENNKYFVYPYYSLSTDYSDVGTHNKDESNNTVFQVQMQYGQKRYYNLPSLDNCDVKYDGFFENEAICSHLEIEPENCCVDLNGNKKNREKKRFWLSCEIKNYKILKSYNVNYRPIDVNVLNDNYGKDIFLYDTSIEEKNVYKKSKKTLTFRFYMRDVFMFMRLYGCIAYYIDPIIFFYYTLKKKLKRKFVAK